MVLLGGIVLSLLLLLVVYAALYFRYVRLDQKLKPLLIYDLLLIISSLAIVLFGVWAIVKVFWN
jgi:hypothetical protein